MSVAEPRTDRPHMPGYGILGPDEGSGLLPWSWAEERLARSHDYWVATVWPDGRPQVTPVWGMWDSDVLWFSCSRSSRKFRNLSANPICVATTDDALQPVVLEGTVEVVDDLPAIEHMLGLMNAKYDTDYGMDFMDPAMNAAVHLRPRRAFGLTDGDFTGSPTRWTFGP